jgi:membrane associated rhomboid family serine protease
VLEVLYLSIAVVTLYQGVMFLRRGGPARRGYAWRLMATGVLAALAYTGLRSGAAGWLGAAAGPMSIVGCVALVLLPPMLRAVTRGALARDHVRLALLATHVREILAPGLGARQDRRAIQTLRAIRAGETDATLGELRARRAVTEDAGERTALDDRILELLVSSERWPEVVAELEGRSGGFRTAQVPFLVEIVRAYGELGRLNDAARLVTILENLPGVGEPALAYLVARARLLFLAYAGRVAAVERLLAAPGPLAHMPAASRPYWTGVARDLAGDPDGAREALRTAVSRAGDRRRRELAERRLDTVGATPARVLDPELAGFADAVLERALAASAEAPPQLEGLGAGAIPATLVIVAANLVAYGLVAWLLGSSEAVWNLERAGALLKPAVRAGEWWRLWSATLLHVGLLHLAVNMLSLWRLGQLVEQMYGSLRFAAVYVVAALGGALASLWFGRPGLSAGASGAIFGILGAAIADVAVRARGAGRQAWPRALLGNLVFVALANLAIGAAVPLIDQAAHVGGLISGGLAGLAFTPRTRLGRRLGGLAAVAAAAGIALTALAAWGVATTPYARTIARLGYETHTVGGVRVELPRAWVFLNDESEPAPPWPPSVSVDVTRRADMAAIVEVVRDKLGEDERSAAVAEVPPSVVAPDWTGHELRFRYRFEDGVLAFRKGIYMLPRGDSAVVVTVLGLDGQAGWTAPVVEHILRSVAP